ncbi:MAG: ATP-binding protein [Acidobacteriota bacterium]
MAEAPRSKAELLAIIADSVPAVVAYCDTDERFVYANRYYTQRFARGSALVGATIRHVIGEAAYAHARPHIQRVLAGEIATFEMPLTDEHDGAIWVSATYVPDRGPDGRVRGFSALSEDITSRRAAEDALRATNRTLELLADAGRVLASSLDHRETLERAVRLAVPHYGEWCVVDLLAADGRHVDRVAVATHGAERDAIAAGLPRRFALARVDRGIARVIARAESVLDTAVAADDIRAIAPDARSYASAPLVVRGHAIGALTVASSRELDERDLWAIEELARQAAAAIDNARLFAAERHARERVSRLQEVTAALSRARTAGDVAEVTCRIGSQAMEAQSGVIWLADGEGGLVMAGHWGTPEGFIEHYRVLPPGDERFPAISVVRTGVPVYAETREDWRRIAPTLFDAVEAAGRLAAYAALPMGDREHIVGVIVFSHPLGHRYDDGDRAFYATLAQHCQQALERARLLDEARAASDAAARANRPKDEFLAMLGHELRNPLAPIVTALELIRARGESAFERERAIVERQVHHLRRLVDDLLDVSAITNGRVQLEHAPLALDAVLAQAVETTRPLLDKRRQQLAIELGDALHVEGDAMRLAQVFTNLLTNAAKYTPPGGHIAIRAARERGEIVVRVCDDGAGMSAELLPYVFDLFQQGPQQLDRAQGGLGLGLAIVKSLVTLHGGTVSAHSDGANRGSELVVRLPASTAPGPAAQPEALARDHTSRRVLVVDDNHDAAALLAEALAVLGYATHVAHDGEEAMRVAASFAPELALLDLGLPTIDGYELARRMRVLLRVPKLIAITGYGQEADRARSRAAGFDAHLVKPVDLATLQATLTAVLRASDTVGT